MRTTMTIDRCEYKSANDQAGRYVLQFSAKRVESDYEGVFFTRGGSLGSCAARGDLDVSLTHSTRAAHTLLTEQLQQGLELEIPQELVANNIALQARSNYSEGLEANGHKLGPVLFISDRARMNLSSSRIGASINGSVVTSLSGQASMALKDIFAEPQSLGDVLKVSAEGADASTDATTGAPVEAMPQITGELIKKAKVLVPLNFESIPLTYSNWDAVQSVVSVHEPKVFRVCEDGTRSGPVAVAFVSDKATDLALAKAEPLLTAVAPYVQKFHSSEYINALANGDICVAFGWSGDILQARDRAAEADNGVEIAYHAAKEGAQMWFDQMAIPADAPNPDAAHTFLNFIMDAQNMADASNYVYYANGNLASQPLLEEDVIGDPAIYPDAATLENLFTTSPYAPKVQRVVTRMWTKIKSGT